MSSSSARNPYVAHASDGERSPASSGTSLAPVTGGGVGAAARRVVAGTGRVEGSSTDARMREAFVSELGGKRGPFVQVGEVGVAGATLTTGRDAAGRGARRVPLLFA